MVRLTFGKFARSGATVRKVAVAGGIAAVAGGLAIGIATAADPIGQVPFPGPGGLPPPVAPPLRGPRPAAAAAAAPLHRTLVATLRGGLQDQTAPTQRALVGRFVSAVGANGTFRVMVLVNGQRRQVLVTPETKLPGRLPRPGEPVLIIGQVRADGVFVARGVALQPKPEKAPAATPTPAKR